jgi:hypothetical protein
MKGQNGISMKCLLRDHWESEILLMLEAALANSLSYERESIDGSFVCVHYGARQGPRIVDA